MAAKKLKSFIAALLAAAVALSGSVVSVGAVESTTTYSSSSVSSDIHALFDSSDYKMLKLNSQYSLWYLQNLKSTAESSGADEETLYLINRAISITNGTLTYDSELEFQPERKGELYKEPKDNHQLWFYGTNRQITGIWASPGKNSMFM